jgi:hypothetical protein
MADGRNYASWQPGGSRNADIRRKENITSNWEYRKYLINNATNIIQGNMAQACDQCCACPARYPSAVSHSITAAKNTSTPDTVRTTVPFLYKSCVEKTRPFGYETSDLKNIYLTKQQLEARMSTPVVTQDQLILGGYQNFN